MDYTIRQLFEKILNGQIQIPVFQRGFVWEPDMVASLMDSIYKSYPFGSLLFWRTRESLKSERNIGPFHLIEKEAGLPVDYVLDGQQRITSIFGVFQTELSPIGNANAFEIYFDYSIAADAQEPQFFALQGGDVDVNKHFPLNTLFDSVKYRAATAKLSEKVIQIIDKLQSVFKEARIPVQILETEDRSKVAIVFERINRKGVPLDTFQLLSAWTWSEDFNLQAAMGSLTDDLAPFGFDDIGEDINLILRCSAAILSHNSTTKSLINLSGSEVRDRFEEVANGIKGAIDFLRLNLHLAKLDNLPYPTMLIPMSVFFAVSGTKMYTADGEQRKAIVKWFWRVCFSKRYSAGVLKSLNKDVEEMVKLRNHEDNELGLFPSSVKREFFIENTFNTNSVNTKAFILMLAQKSPKSLISGSIVSLQKVLKEANKNEFHHLYPKSYLKSIGINDEALINVLANFSFLSKTDNIQISGSAPSVYRSQLPKDVSELSSILEASLIPNNLFDDNFNDFIKVRSEKLLGLASSLIS